MPTLSSLCKNLKKGRWLTRKPYSNEYGCWHADWYVIPDNSLTLRMGHPWEGSVDSNYTPSSPELRSDCWFSVDPARLLTKFVTSVEQQVIDRLTVLKLSEVELVCQGSNYDRYLWSRLVKPGSAVVIKLDDQGLHIGRSSRYFNPLDRTSGDILDWKACANNFLIDRHFQVSK